MVQKDNGSVAEPSAEQTDPGLVQPEPVGPGGRVDLPNVDAVPLGPSSTLEDRVANAEAIAQTVLEQRAAFDKSRIDNAPLGFPDDLHDTLDASERLARARAVAEGGQEPASVSHSITAAPPVNGNQSAADLSAPRGFFGVAGTYIQGFRDILSSSAGLVVTSYTLDAAAISADANGDKIVPEGTTLQASGVKVAPRTGTNACVGVLFKRVNARNGDQDIGMVVGGRLRSDKLTDAGVFGSVVSGAVTQLAAMGVYLSTFDA
jgi:hypothetical protein